MSKQIDELGQYRGLNLVHLNIRSLFSKIDLSKTTFSNANIQILGFSETWLSDVVPKQLVNIPGFVMYRNDRKIINSETNQIKKGGGVGLYVSNKLNCTVHQLKDFDCDESVSRGRMTGTRGRGTGTTERRDEPSERRNEGTRNPMDSSK